MASAHTSTMDAVGAATVISRTEPGVDISTVIAIRVRFSGGHGPRERAAGITNEWAWRSEAAAMAAR
jgi:hypothetical protein